MAKNSRVFELTAFYEVLFLRSIDLYITLHDISYHGITLHDIWDQYGH